ncbi:MAG: hypothetical protein UT30_C0001G0090 [Candidatus Uhrbacteria bacterium GW2011_GWF2_39_13]|uniref:Uncharacterized protein n=1 Tax=Candidatus Uhrbacteria bacterium GW2011_GWF2_39_13 TaxID=1618995 RepID=A0A0G0MXD8_9BACT|nr:MAG: hypothetical protein UT30_C0001G0090 [Candidatus Uhrbacteria bacterium GW2011_GWF2_39_13]HAU66417.1 hypothetical protein [Candidatus Uhrbacteria bacterium]
MITLLSQRTREKFGIVDPTNPVFKVRIEFDDQSPPKITMSPYGGSFIRDISQAVLQEPVPNQGIFAYEICLGELAKIQADDQVMARKLLKRFGRLMQESIDHFSQMLSSLPKKEIFVPVVVDAMTHALVASHNLSRPFHFKWKVTCPDCVPPSQEIELSMVFFAGAVTHQHPFFEVFVELLNEAVSQIVFQKKREAIMRFLAELAFTRAVPDLKCLN